jgi:hypothetical protein
MLNGLNYWELRRMAIAPQAPKNTASRLLRIMTLMIRREKPQIVKLISYQDTAVHRGTIYKASGWEIGQYRKGGHRSGEWETRRGRIEQTLIENSVNSDKIRWEKDINA